MLPELASVGLTEAAAREKGLDRKVARGISAGQMRETVYAFPTMASDIRNML